MTGLLTAREVAERFRVTVPTVVRLTRRGELPAIRDRDGELRYPLRYAAVELEAWLGKGAAPRGGCRANPAAAPDREATPGYRVLVEPTRRDDAATTEEE